VIACAKEKFWKRLPTALGVPELASDPRFANYEARSEHRGELEAILEARLAERTTAEWIEILENAGVPCGPVNDVAAALADPQALARGMIVETQHPRFGRVRQVASPVRVGAARSEHRRAPTRDEDRDDILRNLLGYSDEACRALRERRRQ
jgi:crotonobetainyl-CoA:carnitine CoA-transferase CaiB-like acyl-CoA transferase